jgi:hypothetical protein
MPRTPFSVTLIQEKHVGPKASNATAANHKRRQNIPVDAALEHIDYQGGVGQERGQLVRYLHEPGREEHVDEVRVRAEDRVDHDQSAHVLALVICTDHKNKTDGPR